jgi:hypothetical protein
MLDRIKREIREDPYYGQNYSHDGQRFEEGGQKEPRVEHGSLLY